MGNKIKIKNRFQREAEFFSKSHDWCKKPPEKEGKLTYKTIMNCYFNSTEQANRYGISILDLFSGTYNIQFYITKDIPSAMVCIEFPDGKELDAKYVRALITIIDANYFEYRIIAKNMDYYIDAENYTEKDAYKFMKQYNGFVPDDCVNMSKEEALKILEKYGITLK